MVSDSDGSRDITSLPAERNPSQGDPVIGIAERQDGRSLAITSSDPVRV